MDSVNYRVNEISDLVAAELGPFLYLGRILNRFDVDAGLLFELGHAVVAVAVIGRGIFLVHHQSVFVPKAAAEDHVGIADIVQLHIVHLRNISNPTIEVNKVLPDVRIGRVKCLVI